MNLLGLKKSQVINLMYKRQRKKTLTRAQIRRSIDLLLKIANDPIKIKRPFDQTFYTKNQGEYSIVKAEII